MMHDVPAVHTHTLLESRGGATWVARAVHEGVMQHAGLGTMSFEIAENADTPAGNRLYSAPMIGACARAEGAELLHIHGTLDWGACLEGLGEGLPLVVTLHDCSLITGGCFDPLECTNWRDGCRGRCARGVENAAEKCARHREALRRSDVTLVSPSRWLADMARECMPGVNVNVIPNGVPWPKKLVPKAEAREYLKVPQGANMVLFAAHGGTRAQFKAGHKWEALWGEIQRQVPDALCFMVGGDALKQSGNLVHLPYVDRQTMTLLMRASDVFAYPTLADNHPLVVLEAMSLALPCVAFGVGGVLEQIVHEQTGVLVPPDDWGGFARQVAVLLRRRSLAREIGLAAHEAGRKYFRLERMQTDYLKLYRQHAAALL